LVSHAYAVHAHRERRVVGEQRRDLGEREHEHEVEEELARGDAVLLVDCRRDHRRDVIAQIAPTSRTPLCLVGGGAVLTSPDAE
jgi:hypothetical protein